MAVGARALAGEGAWPPDPHFEPPLVGHGQTVLRRIECILVDDARILPLSKQDRQKDRQ